MEGQLRSSVGFLGGGGVTPSPTPTPKARLARFILAQYGVSGEVQVLTDTYGRILTQHDPDGDVRYAVVWVPGDSRIDWDDASDQELVTLLSKYGYNDALTIENNNVTINDNGETETLTWDRAAMDFTVDVEMFHNGAQNFYFRTVNDGSQDVTVLCDADGKAIHAPELGSYNNVLFTVAENGTKIDTITSDSSISREGVSNACGGDVRVTALDAGASVFLLVMGTHIQFCNADDTTTTPSVRIWPGQLITKKTLSEEDPAVVLLGDNRLLVVNGISSGQTFFVFAGGRYNTGSYDPNAALIKDWIEVYGIYETNAVDNMGTYVFSVLGEQYSYTQGVITPAPLG